jgi:hypothetical protein
MYRRCVSVSAILHSPEYEHVLHDSCWFALVARSTKVNFTSSQAHCQRGEKPNDDNARREASPPTARPSKRRSFLGFCLLRLIMPPTY